MLSDAANEASTLLIANPGIGIEHISSGDYIAARIRDGVARLTASADPWLDRAEKLPRIACEGVASVCEKTSVGFPGGMCSGPCDPNDASGTCGGIAILSDFNQCLAERRPFGECLRQHTRPGNLRSCSADKPCRDDFICAQADGQPEGRGACIPPYFLFQMRVDGHS